MKFSIKHESRGRIRVQLAQRRMTLDQADLVETWLQGLDAVDQAAVHERTCCAIIYYKGGSRAAVLKALRGFSYQSEEAAKLVVPHTSRATNREYQEKLVGMVCGKAVRDMFFPAPLRMVWTLCRSLPYLGRAVRCLWSCWMACPWAFPWHGAISALPVR